MDFALSEEQRHWGKVARKFAYESVRPRALELDRVADPSQTFPADLIREASRLGLRTLKIPKEYGGAGVDALTEVIVQEELSAGDVGLGMTLQHAWREGYILAAATTDAQRERFLPAFMNDDSALMAFSLSEEHAGSDHGARYAETLAAGPQTRAVREGDHWVINGHKRWTTNGNVAKFVILCARTDPGVPWPEGISMFVVPTDTPGYRVERVLDKVGIRLNQNTDTVFENCRIPADNLLGELNGGFAFLERFAAGSSAKEAPKRSGSRARRWSTRSSSPAPAFREASPSSSTRQSANLSATLPRRWKQRVRSFGAPPGRWITRRRKPIGYNRWQSSPVPRPARRSACARSKFSAVRGS